MKVGKVQHLHTVIVRDSPHLSAVVKVAEYTVLLHRHRRHIRVLFDEVVVHVSAVSA